MDKFQPDPLYGPLLDPNAAAETERVKPSPEQRSQLLHLHEGDSCILVILRYLKVSLRRPLETTTLLISRWLSS